MSNEDTILAKFNTGDALLNVLSASPFSTDYNLDGLLTAEYFFKHLYVGKGDNLKYKEFEKAILEELDSKETIYIQGFSGTGKTTFINKFIRDKHFDDDDPERMKLLAFCKIDCSAITSKKSLSKYSSEDIKAQERAIQESSDQNHQARLKKHLAAMKREKKTKRINNALAKNIRHYLSNVQELYFCGDQVLIDDNFIENFLRKLLEEKHLITSYFSSLNKALKKLSLELNEKKPDIGKIWSKLLTSLGINSIFLLLYLFLAFIFNSNKDGSLITRVVVFDNLDNLPSLLLHQQLQAKILESASNAKIVAQKIFRGTPLKLLLLIRDSNSAALTDAEHMTDHMRPKRIIRLNDEDFYKSIVIKRLNFFKDTILPYRGRASGKVVQSDDDVRITLQQFVEDPYFDDVTVPAFNMDYRKIAVALFSPTRTFVDSSDSKSYFDDNKKIKEEYLPGFRGVMFFNLMKEMQIGRFFTDLDRLSSPEGYCLAARMILTMILNKSNIKDIDRVSITHNEDFLDTGKVKILEVIEAARQVYSYKEILEALTTLSLSNQNYPYLVSFLNRKPEADWYEDVLLKNDEGAFIDAIDSKKLEDDFVRITPAGIIFLRDIVAHYETYSQAILANISNDRDHASYNKGLFISGFTSTSQIGPLLFLFETAIPKVFRAVERHSRTMHRFYVSKFGGDRQKYVSSLFIFKYSKGKYDGPACFHITRVVSSHIEYIDNFRLLFLKHRSDSKLNNDMIKFIEDYANLLKPWEGDPVTDSYYARIKDNIQQIRQGDLKYDRQISVDLLP